MMNGLAPRYHLGESTFILGTLGVIFNFSYKFFMKSLFANRIAPDGTPQSVASHLGLYCLPMSHKKDARLTVYNITPIDNSIQQMSRLVGKPTMWFPNGSDTNEAVQSQKQAISLKFRIK